MPLHHADKQKSPDDTKKMSAVSSTITPAAIGSEYQKATVLIVISTINICSGPYATDDKASDDKMASAFVLLSFCSPNASDLNGLPIT